MTFSKPSTLRRLTGLLLALALLAPASAFGRILYACSMSGKVTASRCCCHARDEVQAAKRPAVARAVVKVERASCCEAQSHERASVPAAAARELSELPAAALVAILPAIEPERWASELLRVERGAARGPPLALAAYLRNCALLV